MGWGAYNTRSRGIGDGIISEYTTGGNDTWEPDNGINATYLTSSSSPSSLMDFKSLFNNISNSNTSNITDSLWWKYHNYDSNMNNTSLIDPSLKSSVYTGNSNISNIIAEKANKPTFPSYLNEEKRWNFDNPGAGSGNGNGEGGLWDWFKNGDNLKGLAGIAGVGVGLWNAYNQYQAFKENKKTMEQMRRFNEENQARQRYEWARKDNNIKSLSASWNG